MSRHPTEELIQRFVDGTLEEDVAVAVATHIDDCPRCANHVAVLDPLSPAFAAVEDPPVPADLVRCIAAQVAAEPHRAQPRSTWSVGAGISLLASAMGLLILSGDAFAAVTQVTLGLGAALTALSVLAGHFEGAWLATATLGFAVCVAVVLSGRRWAWIGRSLPRSWS